MSEINIAQLFWVCASIFALLFSLWAWRRSVIELSKQRLFSIRAELFDSAAASHAFADETYCDTRWTINGVLRDIDSLSGPIWLYYGFMYWRKREQIKKDFAKRADAQDSLISDAVLKARRDMSRALKRHLWFSGPVSSLTMLIALMCGKISLLVQVVFSEAERVGKDDSYAATKMLDRICRPAAI